MWRYDQTVEADLVSARLRKTRTSASASTTGGPCVRPYLITTQLQNKPCHSERSEEPYAKRMSRQAPFLSATVHFCPSGNGFAGRFFAFAQNDGYFGFVDDFSERSTSSMPQDIACTR
jgi:hypothetical protein